MRRSHRSHNKMNPWHGTTGEWSLWVTIEKPDTVLPSSMDSNSNKASQFMKSKQQPFLGVYCVILENLDGTITSHETTMSRKKALGFATSISLQRVPHALHQYIYGLQRKEAKWQRNVKSFDWKTNFVKNRLQKSQRKIEDPDSALMESGRVGPGSTEHSVFYTINDRSDRCQKLILLSERWWCKNIYFNNKF